MSQRLEHRRAHNGVPREQEAEGDDPQGWDADGQQITGVILRPEQVQQDMGGELEGQQTGQHDSYRSSHTELDGLDDPVRTACPVVVGHDGHHAVIQAEYRHEDEGLELEIDAKHRGGGGGEGDQDLVHAEHHHRADGGHDDGGNAHAVDPGDDAPVRAESAEAELDVVVAGQIKEERESCSDELADHRSQGGARHLQPKISMGSRMMLMTAPTA